MTTHRLEIIDLGCARGDRVLFEGLSLQIAGGELLHVAGSNGSGKTTLLRTLCGLSRPAAGDIRWQGESVRSLGDDYRRHLAYVGHYDGVQGELTPAENLRAFLCLADHRSSTDNAVDHALERFGLAAQRSFPAKILSQGQKRRVALARLLLVKKPIWILDEPFTALDTASCRLVGDLLAEHLAAGGLAAISSHQDFQIRGVACNRIDMDALRRGDAFFIPGRNAASHAAARKYPA